MVYENNRFVIIKVKSTFSMKRICSHIFFWCYTLLYRMYEGIHQSGKYTKKQYNNKMKIVLLPEKCLQMYATLKVCVSRSVGDFVGRFQTLLYYIIDMNLNKSLTHK